MGSISDYLSYSGRDPRLGGASNPYTPTTRRTGGTPERRTSPVESVRATRWLNDLVSSGGETAVGWVGALAQAPARITETPLSLGFQAIEGLTGKKPEQEIGNIPVIGEILEGLGGAYDAMSTAIAAWQNMNDVDLYRRIANMRDDEQIDPLTLLSRAGGPFNLSSFADPATISRTLTVGDFKADLIARGWTAQDFADIETGRKSSWDYGDKLLSSNVAADFVSRVALDPTNLLFTSIPAKIGVALKSTRAGDALTTAVGQLWNKTAGSEVVQRFSASGWGMGDRAYNALQRVGGRTRVAPPASQIANDIARGQNLVGGTMSGIGEFARRIPMLPTAARLARAYVDPRGWTTRTGYLKRSAATYGMTAVLANLPDGLLEDQQRFAEDVLARQPLSNSTTFMVAAAMLTPGALVARGTYDDTLKAAHDFAGGSLRREIENLHGGLSWDEIAGRTFGGEEGLHMRIFSAAASIIQRRSAQEGGLASSLRSSARSLIEHGTGADLYGNEIRVLTVKALENRKISPRDIVEEMIEQYEKPEAFRATEFVLPDGRKIRVDEAGVRSTWNPEVAIERWNQYADAVGSVSKVVDTNIRHTIGLRDFYTRGQMDIVIAAGRELGDSISLAEVRAFIDRHQILLRMAERDRLLKFYETNAPDVVRGDDFVKILEDTKANPFTPLDDAVYELDRAYDLKSLLRTQYGKGPNQLASIRHKVEASQRPFQRGPIGDYRPAPFEAFEAARAQSTRGEFMTPHTPEEFAKNTAYLSSDGKSGFMLTPEGDLQNVFSLVKGQGAGDAAMKAAIAQGARTLDAFDGFLPTFYAKHGFVETGRMKFVDEFAPEGWNFEKNGRPDVVFMALKEESATPTVTRYFDDWDAAKASASLEAIPEKKFVPIQGLEKANAQYKAELTTALSNRMKQGDRKTVGGRKDLERAIGAELAHARAIGATELEAAAQGALNAIERARIGHKSIDQTLVDYIADLDRANQRIIPVPIPSDTFEKVPTWYMNQVLRDAAYLQQVTDNYTVKNAPALHFVPQMGDLLPEVMMKHRNMLARVLFDEGPLSFPARAMQSLFERVPGDKLNQDTLQAIYEDLTGRGATIKQIDNWIIALRKEADKYVLMPMGGRMEIRLFGGPRNLPANAINSLAEEAFGAGSSVMESIGPNFRGVLDRAISRTYRRIDNSYRRSGNKPGALQRILKDSYYTYRSGVTPAGKRVPIWSTTSDATRLLTTTMYPIFRFAADVRYWAMNALERNFLALGRDGIDAATGPVQASDLSTYGHALTKGQETTDIVRALAAADETGWYYTHRATTARIHRQFDDARPDSAIDVFKDIWDTDPAILKFRRDFPEATPADYVNDLNQKFVNFDNMGVKESLKDAYDDLFSKDPSLAEDAWLNKVALQRLEEVNRQLFDDIKRIHYGNPDRRNIERVLNSYLLYWPLSYQIKATKWLLGVLTERAGGKTTNLLGAAQYEHFRQMHLENMATNQHYAEQFEGQEHLWQTAMMFFPITPEDIGINLSRPMRVAGSMLGIFEPIQDVDDPATAAAYIMEIGPIYTAKLLRTIGRFWEMTPENEEPSGILFGPRGAFGEPTEGWEQYLQPITQGTPVNTGNPITTPLGG